MNICVQGLWHLGTVFAACLADIGHNITAFDYEKKIVDKLQCGEPPIFEPGLAGLVQKGLRTSRLHFTADPQEALSRVNILWIAYDTPVDADDEADSEFVKEQIKKSLPYLPSGAVILVSSQLPIGSIFALEQNTQNICPEKQLMFCCSPENLRLGNALATFTNPDRLIIGYRSEKAKKILQPFLETITTHLKWMKVESAEMTKHALNAFLATSVVFANEIASFCEVTGADAAEVAEGLKSDKRIGPGAYLSPGGPFAGGTLARDVQYLRHIGCSYHIEAPLVGAIKNSNDLHKKWVYRKLNQLFTNLSEIQIAVWGLTYKPGTDTLRRSEAVSLVDWLLSQNAIVRVHDPAVQALPEKWTNKVQRFSDPLAALAGASVLVMAVPWPEYRKVVLPQINSPLIIIDASGFLSSWQNLENVSLFTVGSFQSKGGK